MYCTLKIECAYLSKKKKKEKKKEWIYIGLASNARVQRLFYFFG